MPPIQASIEATMSGNLRISPWLRIPPPLLFVATFLCGHLLHHHWPLVPPAFRGLPGMQVLGGILIAMGVALASSCVGLFAMKRTTLNPSGSARSLLTVGPYRLSRNPMYLSLVLAYLGTACLLAEAWPLLLLLLPVAILHLKVIPFEEARLHAVFGDAYTRYCAKVRRWL